MCFYNQFTGFIKIFFYREAHLISQGAQWYIKTSEGKQIKLLDEPTYLSRIDSHPATNDMLLFSTMNDVPTTGIEFGWNGFEFQVSRYSTDLTNMDLKIGAYEKHIRAFAYFELVTLWGNAPLITEAERTDLKVHNSTPDALWALIEDDLEAAINPKVLPEKTSLDDNITSIRITHQLAQALLGKAYVFQGKYAEAMTILDEVIDSGKFDLFQGNISDLFIAANNNNRESMFVVNKANDPALNTFGFVSIMTGWRPEKFDNLFALSASGALDVYTNGFGYLNPTKELYEAFVDEKGEDGYRLNETIKTYKRMNSELGLQLASGEYYYGSEGYFSWKHRSSPQNYVQGTWAGFWNNDYIMRFAEVLLLAAEAHIQGGGTRADEYINRIRERAHLAPISNATMDDLKKEKRLELCIESVRFQDLVRWGDAATLLKDQGKQVPALYGIKDDGTMDIRFTWTNADAGFVAGKHDLLPFPQAEMNVNPNIEQNLNW